MVRGAGVVRFSVAIITLIVLLGVQTGGSARLAQNHRGYAEIADEVKMTDWKKIASALKPPIPDADIDRIVPTLEALEKSFRPLQAAIPPGADIWTGPEDVE